MAWFPVIVCLGLASLACGGVVYSPSYAKVEYQGVTEDTAESDSVDTKEEVTIPPTFCNVNPTPTVDSDTVTEADSETVNATKVYTSRGPKKLHGRIELSEDFEPTEEPDLEPSDPPVKEEQGVYYIIHPNGILQRIIFNARDDLAKMEYQANLNYQDVQPVVDPVYTYDPNTLFFQTLQ